MAEEEWDFVDGLKRTKTARVCMTCQHFSYVCDQHCHTLLTCGLQRRQVPHGEHLTKKCRHWMVRREVEVGWCPEVALWALTVLLVPSCTQQRAVCSFK